ncbi:MAG: hypothetical protein RLZZ135_2644, partial [Cyanobacteriota bacterium]
MIVDRNQQTYSSVGIVEYYAKLMA